MLSRDANQRADGVHGRGKSRPWSNDTAILRQPVPKQVETQQRNNWVLSLSPCNDTNPERRTTMRTTLRRFEKRIGDVRVEIFEDTSGGRISHEITFTRRQFDGTEVPTFSNEGDLSQLATAVGRAQAWLQQRQNDWPCTEEPYA
jgi:hypothetical protein